jgi:hypothetical protein
MEPGVHTRISRTKLLHSPVRRYVPVVLCCNGKDIDREHDIEVTK